ncbi:MAG: endonuclease/exonuclease/phosphatase, partial [Chitinophagales bacterium]
MNKIILAFALAIISMSTYAQKNVEVAVIGFYNLENLFDTINDLEKNDEDFLPKGSYKYNSKVYHDKLNNLSSILAQLGTEITPDGAALIGVCEVENKSVLVDLVKEKSIANRNYEIVHYDSPDKRGIDVGL